jgi:hypothetical protein
MLSVMDVYSKVGGRLMLLLELFTKLKIKLLIIYLNDGFARIFTFLLGRLIEIRLP